MTTRSAAPRARIIRSADLLAVGSELTTGETQDTNGGELARSLGTAGVSVRRILALPDDLALVTDAFRDAFGAVDLVVTTGGLGPTPDDLTREAVAGAIGEEPAVDARLERWLRAMYRRRKMAFPTVNLKQAWLIPSATSIPNANGTAPGWWVDRPDGRVAVLLPGPPREMRPMWREWVVPRLRERGLGDGRVVRTLRTYGIGESVVAERLGDALLRAPNPVVATYARADWLDIRISAVDEPGSDGAARPAAAVVDDMAARVRQILAGHVWAEGETGWSELVADAVLRAGRRLATVEAGTGGTLLGILAGIPGLERATVLGTAQEREPSTFPVEERAEVAAREAGTDLGLALVARTSATETVVRAAVWAAGDREPHVLDLRLFQHGPHGLFRAGVAAAAFLVEALVGSPAAR